MPKVGRVPWKAFLERSKTCSAAPRLSDGITDRRFVDALNCLRLANCLIEGIGPDMRLFWIMSSSRLVRLANAGKVEEKLFDDRSKADKLGQMPSQFPIAPLSRLLKQRKTLRLVNAEPIELGTVELSKLSYTESICNNPREEIEDGIAPLILLEWSHSDLKFVSELPTKDGIDPEILLPNKKSSVSGDKDAKLEGSEQENALVCSLSD